MEISGSTNSLVALGMAMSQARVESAMSVSAVKKGLDAQAAALSLIATVQQVQLPAAGGDSGSQVDVIA